jgi:hypothetical protein
LSLYNAEKILFANYAPFVQIDVAYDIDVAILPPRRSANQEGKDIIALGGAQESINYREDVFYSITLARLAASDLPTIREFLYSAGQGNAFTFDINGSVASPDEIITMYFSRRNYDEPRKGFADRYTVDINTRVAD